MRRAPQNQSATREWRPVHPLTKRAISSGDTGESKKRPCSFPFLSLLPILLIPILVQLSAFGQNPRMEMLGDMTINEDLTVDANVSVNGGLSLGSPAVVNGEIRGGPLSSKYWRIYSDSTHGHLFLNAIGNIYTYRLVNIAASAFIRENQFLAFGDSQDFSIGHKPSNDNLVIGSGWGLNSPLISVTTAGNLGIGTTAPSSKLEVAGDVRVTGGSFIDDGTAVQAPDYVFAPEYNLLPLDKVKDFIIENRHLPNVPSAADFEENGVNLSQLQMKLLEKIEELTLYTLHQETRIQELESKMLEISRSHTLQETVEHDGE